MNQSAPPSAITDLSLEVAAAPRRLAHQMAIDAGLAGDSSLLHAFDEAERAVDKERAQRFLRALHRMVDDAFEHQLQTMFSTPDAFERLVLEMAQLPEGHRAN